MPNQKVSYEDDATYYLKVNKIFPDINVDVEHSDFVAVYYVSLKQFELLKQIPQEKLARLPAEARSQVKPYLLCDYERIIGELDSKYAIKELEDPDVGTALGIGANEMGLLFSNDSPTGDEDLNKVLSDMPAEMIKSLFGASGFKEEFLHVPFIFSYLTHNSNEFALASLMQAPAIRDALAQGKKPVLICINPNSMPLPQEILAAKQDKKIKVLEPKWLNRPNYRPLVQFLFNKGIQCLVSPSGDNTLIECIKAGVLPLYTHRKPYEINDKPNNKSGFFAQLSLLLKSDEFPRELKVQPGYEDYLKLTEPYEAHLIMSKEDFLKVLNKPEFYMEKSKFITNDAVNFFKQHLAPYLRENFDFKTKTLPILLQDLRKYGFNVGTSKAKAYKLEVRS
jgi:hypothetical protein